MTAVDLLRIVRFTTLLLAPTSLVVGQELAIPPQVQEQDAPPAPIVIPDISLDGLEPEIAGQLQTLRAIADSALGAGEVESSANALADLARHYHAYEFYDAAASAYEATLQVRLEETSAYLLALVQRQRGEFEGALHLFSVVSSRQPNYLAARYYQALTLFDLGRFDESRASIPEGTDSPAFLVLLGRLALEGDSPEIAATFFVSAIEKAPTANRTHYLLAQAYRAAGEREKAAAALANYGPVGIKPSDPLMDGVHELRVGSTPFTLSGRRAYAAGRFEEAVELFRKALAARPDDAGLMVNLASALAQTGDSTAIGGSGANANAENRAEESRSDTPIEAIALLQRSLEIDPQNGVARFNLGVLLHQVGSLKEAAMHLALAIQLEPTDMGARAELVRVLARLGRLSEALAMLAPLRDTPLYNEGLRLLELQLLVGLQQFDSAYARLEDSLNALPASGLLAHAAARFFASVPSYQHRNGQRALDLASRVFEVTGAAQDAITVAYALAELGNCKQAAQWMKTAQAGLSEEADLDGEQRLFWQRTQTGEDCRPVGR